MRVRVQDGGSPPKYATAVLKINIDYNLQDPVFDNLSGCTKTISEIHNVNLAIDTVFATDADTKVSDFLLLCEVMRGSTQNKPKPSSPI